MKLPAKELAVIVVAAVAEAVVVLFGFSWRSKKKKALVHSKPDSISFLVHHMQNKKIFNITATHSSQLFKTIT